MKRYLESHIKVLKGVYYFLFIILFAELIIFAYYHMVNEKAVKMLQGVIHYDGNHSLDFDINEVVVDLNETRPNIIYVEDNSTNPSKPNKKTKIIKSTVYKFEYDNNYNKNCELEEDFVCASSKKILGYAGNKLYLDKIYVSSDKSVIIGLFEHNIYAYKKIYNNESTCADKSFGKYEIKNNKLYLDEKASVYCDGCVNTNKTKDYSFEIKNKTIKDSISNKDLILQEKYNEYVVNIAYELGYFDGNILCKDIGF